HVPVARSRAARPAPHRRSGTGTGAAGRGAAVTAPPEPVIALVGRPGRPHRTALADVLIVVGAGPRASELLGRYPGLTLVLAVHRGGRMVGTFRDGTVVAPRRSRCLPIRTAARILYRWWVDPAGPAGASAANRFRTMPASAEPSATRM